MHPHPRTWFAMLWLGLAVSVSAAAPLQSGEAPSLRSTNDWPMYRHDAQRSAVTDERLVFPLAPAWTYTCAQPPAPAWPEQLGLFNRMDFDYAPQLVVAEGLVCFGSSADDTVRALDAGTGVEKWRFVTGGPVRFAPSFGPPGGSSEGKPPITGGKVYFGSDDGWLYCLEAATGKPVWTFRLGLGPDLMIANHRLVSRWPARSGVLVDDGVVYVVGGMLSTEGVFVYALNAETGAVLWCNDTLNFGGMSFTEFQWADSNLHHQGEYSGSGSNPHGALLLGGGLLLIPNGHGGATPLDRRTGKPVHWPPGGSPGSGGTWMTTDRGRLFTFAKHGQGGNRFVIQDYTLTNGVAGRGFGVDRLPQLVMYPYLKPGEVHSAGKVSAIVHDGELYAREAYGIALAGDVLLLGLDGAVVAERAGKQTSAELRFGMAGDDLVVHAIVVDSRVTQAKTPWEGSCVEVFGAAPGQARIGQVLLAPASGTNSACAFLAQNGKPAPAPEIRLQTTPTSNGYELAALVPLPLLALTKTNLDCRLEAQVTVGGPDGTLQRDTLYGSPRAYEDSQKFGLFKLRPTPALASPGAVRDALKTTKANPITMRAAGALWRGPVTGEARDLAVAGGRLFVSTRNGTIHCFAPAPEKSEASSQKSEARNQESGARNQGTGDRVQKSESGTENPDQSKIQNQKSAIAGLLQQAGINRGFAVVFGDAEGRLSETLAAETPLHVTCVLTNGAAADRVRARLLDSGARYGTRVHVQAVERMDRLPFPQWLANAVIVAGSISPVPATELYRVLRPCGGTLLCPDMTSAEAARLVKESGAKTNEIVQNGFGPRPTIGASDGRWQIVRGKLAGALDWDNAKDVPADRLVRWPLRTLWIGGPATRLIRNYAQGAPGPALGGGRYAIGSERALTGVDAYNGTVLWSRPIPQAGATLRMYDGLIYKVAETNTFAPHALDRVLFINDDYVYLQLSKDCLRGAGEAKIRLDARTGEQVKFYGPYHPPVPVSLKTPQTWPIEADAQHAGVVTMEAAPSGLTLTLVTKDPVVTSVDAWELCFDFRPIETRYGLYERGAFHVIVTVPQTNAAPRWTPGSGPEQPRLEVSGACTTDGTRTVVVLPWADLEKLAGAKPASFAFAATLNSRDGGRDEPIARRHLFGDWTADTINNGWASVALDESAVGAGAATPAIVGGPVSALKERSGRTPQVRSLDESVWKAPRIHPLTGEWGPKLYRVPTGCGGAFFSSTIISGRAGINDFADDSGMRFLAGVKARCTSPEVIGNGLLIVSEETGHCGCNWPFRCSTALAPVEERQQEDWAVFHDRAADTRVRQACINFGAPGDRRAADGRLWLGFPRPAPSGMNYSLSAAGASGAATASGVWMRFWPAALQVPLDVTTFAGADPYRPEDDEQTYWKWMIKWAPNRWNKPFGPHRVNADRAGIQGTDRPWIYASHYMGIRQATLRMNFIEPLTADPVAAAPKVDGRLDDPAWARGPSTELPFTKTAVFVRSDADALYVAARRDAVINKRGESVVWSATTTGENASVWADDAFEVFLGGPDRVVHFGVSASGARYDALAVGTNGEDKTWEAGWRSAAQGGTNGLAFELAIPWKTLAEAGLDQARLGFNAQMNQRDVTGEEATYKGGHGRNFAAKETAGEALYPLGWQGRTRCAAFAPLGAGVAPVVPPRAFTVRLHFAELDPAAQPGRRVFDVKLQGQTVLKGFDIVKEAGGLRKALVKEFKGVKAGETLAVEFVPSEQELTPANAPLLCGLEVSEE